MTAKTSDRLTAHLQSGVGEWPPPAPACSRVVEAVGFVDREWTVHGLWSRG